MTRKGGRPGIRTSGKVANRGGVSVRGDDRFSPTMEGAGELAGSNYICGPGGLVGASAAAAADGGPPPELLAQMFGGRSGAAAAFPAAAANCGCIDDGVDRSKWLIIYPTYIDKSKTIRGGRRISLVSAIDEPRVEEMKRIADHLQIPSSVEYLKRYPRDWLLSQGRLRFLLKREDGSFYNPQIPDKKVLMARMGELIPQLKSRNVTTMGGATGGTSTGKKKKK